MSSWSMCMRDNRKKKGLPQKQLAKKSGVSISCIQYYEYGNGEPGLFNLICMADALEIGLDEYIGRKIVQKNQKLCI